jgi:hypothetical protein
MCSQNRQDNAITPMQTALKITLPALVAAILLGGEIFAQQNT